MVLGVNFKCWHHLKNLKNAENRPKNHKNHTFPVHFVFELKIHPKTSKTTLFGKFFKKINPKPTKTTQFYPQNGLFSKRVVFDRKFKCWHQNHKNHRSGPHQIWSNQIRLKRTIFDQFSTHHFCTASFHSSFSLFIHSSPHPVLILYENKTSSHCDVWRCRHTCLLIFVDIIRRFRFEKKL